jgi:hypothetical protein
MPAVLIASHTESGRVTRTRCRSREECWRLADRVVEGWLRKVQGSRYRDPRDRITGAAPGCRGRLVPFRFEVVSP